MLSPRAVTPVVGTALLLAVTLVLASVVVVGVYETPPTEAPRASFAATADADTGRITVTHTGGETVDVGTLRVVVEVDGTRLAHQPPVPFFSARGFAPGPTGPFNTAADPTWTAGETASVRIAGTNRPTLSPDSRVVVTFYSEELVVGRVETVARSQASASGPASSSMVSPSSAVASVASSAPGARATVVMAMSGS